MFRQITRLVGGVLFVACMLGAPQRLAAQPSVTFFRSDHGLPEHTGSLPDRLSNEQLVWRTPLASGHATPALFGDRLFVTEYDAPTQQLSTVAIDRRSGEVLWRRIAPAERIESVHETGNPAAATPACDGQRVYIFFGSYGLLCYDLDGQLVWARPLGPFQDEFGAASSPVLVDDKVILNQDHDADNFLAAFDKRTGELIWRVNRDDYVRSYSTPTVYHQDGQTQIVVAGALRLSAYDANSGSLLWWVDGLARIVNPTPAIADGTLYVATWSPGGDAGERIELEPWEAAVANYDRNSDGMIARSEVVDGPVVSRFFRMDVNQDESLDKAEWERHRDVFARAQNGILAVRLGGEGDVTASHVLWRYQRGIPYVASPTCHDGTVFMVKDSGILTALNAKTGELEKQGRLRGPGNYYASPVVGDGKLYTASQRGVVTVVSAEPDWKVLSSHDFGEDIYATPLLADGQIFIRTSAALYCFGASGER